MKRFDIHKAAGVLLKKRKALVEKSFNKNVYLAPGGKIGRNETAIQALIRELHEEFNINVKERDTQKFGDFYDQSATNQKEVVYMEVFLIKKWSGQIKAGREVEKIAWVNSKNRGRLKIGSIFERQIIPKLKGLDLID